MAKVPNWVPVTWPVGPHYLRWVDGRGDHAWARFKLKSANWYLIALAVAVEEAGGLDRYVGVQMALDGVLTSLCAAIDAAGWGLFEAVERAVAAGADGDQQPAASEQHVRWETGYDLARSAGVELASADAVAEALAGDGSDSPGGWLVQLRLLRDLSVRHNVLVRGLSMGEDTPGRFVEVPGLGLREPMEFLRSTRRRVRRLVDVLLADVDALQERRADALQERRAEAGELEPVRRAGPRPLPDLSLRARVRPPP